MLRIYKYRAPRPISLVTGIQKNVLVWILILLSVPVFGNRAALAQLDTGGITGTVTDPAGAVVPGAKITLTNNGTAVSTVTNSTATGTYSLNAIRPGTYTLQAEAPGFQRFADKGVEVHVQQTLTVDIQFATGTVNQQVTVTAAAPLLQAENAAVGQTITTETVNDLPLQTRDWASLAAALGGSRNRTGRQSQQRLRGYEQRLFLG